MATALQQKEAVYGALKQAQRSARAKDRFQIVSLRGPIKGCDPLDLLEALGSHRKPHFYLEQPTAQSTLFGGGILLSQACEGSGRFVGVRRFIQSMRENAIIVGDQNVPAQDVSCFCAFTLFDHRSNATLPPAIAYLPRWQVAYQTSRGTVTLNQTVAPKSDLETLTDTVWQTHQRIQKAVPSTVKKSDPLTDVTVLKCSEVGHADRFEAAAQHALGCIESCIYQKIVLARAVDLENQHTPFNALRLLRYLRTTFPDCFAFSLSLGANENFIGASPERLIRLKDDRLETVALAGSIRRGCDRRQDQQLAQQLLTNTKERHEHQIVVEALCRHLHALGLEPNVPPQPHVRPLANVHHLESLITASAPLSIMEIMERLHPSPSLGGIPWERVRSDIQQLEPFGRGLYTGLIGWLNTRGEGELVAAIRTALVQPNRMRLYAGAGIVKGSDPQKEKAETNLKLEGIGAAFGLSFTETASYLGVRRQKTRVRIL